MSTHGVRRFVSLFFAVLGWSLAASLSAHCDTLEGPVVAAARAALARGDVTPALAWVQPGQEKEVREQFERSLKVRRQSPEAREMADLYFFETVVRLHRAGEGAPYTGLHSGTKLEPVIAWTDEALEAGGAPDGVIRLVTGRIAAGIRRRFSEAAEAKKRAGDSVEAGRAYVARYVDYTHFVERLYRDSQDGEVARKTEGGTEEPEHAH